MKKLFVILLFLPIAGFAQGDYIIHKVEAKESLTSIGRKYNINGRELAKYNHIDYEKGLSIGQELRIPKSKSKPTPTQTNSAAPVTKVETPKASTGKFPVYHILKPKETLYSLHVKYKVSVDEIKKWNNLTSNGVSEGQKLIVGYSNTKQTDEELGDINGTDVAENQTPMKTVVVEKHEEEVPYVKPAPKEEPKSAPPTVSTTENKKQGFFKSQYSKNPQEEGSVKVAVLKSTSGWTDAKYYCLYDDAAAGTIVKITNKKNGAIVYAKVLDVMPDLKQNQGVDLRLSNAAYKELGMDENEQFDADIEF